jgi:hypothetical protein
MQAIGDIISYFFSYYFNCHAKKCTKIQLGKIYDIFSPSVFIFFPLGHAIIVLLSQTVYGGKILQEGNQIIFFPLYTIFFVTVSELSISTGGKYMIFFPLCLYFCPCVFIFSPCLHFSLLGHAINCSTFAGGDWGKIFFVYSVKRCLFNQLE